MGFQADKANRGSSSTSAQARRRGATHIETVGEIAATAPLAALQRMADSKVLAGQSAQLQAVADVHTASFAGQGPIQRVATVYPEDWEDRRVVIASKGKASEYTGGDDAGNIGWNGVGKYRALAKVGNNDWIDSGSINNEFRAAHAGHILAQQNGGNGSEQFNIFAQDGGVNTGPYRTAFENPMRRDLNRAHKNDKVIFRVSLYADKNGPDITHGPLIKYSDRMEASDEETDFDPDEY